MWKAQWTWPLFIFGLIYKEKLNSKCVFLKGKNGIGKRELIVQIEKLAEAVLFFSQEEIILLIPVNGMMATMITYTLTFDILS